jgi:hypothetical protein
MGAAPRRESDSKVNMEFSRCDARHVSLQVFHNIELEVTGGGSYVKRAQTLAVAIELVVVKLDELLCKTQHVSNWTRS